MELNLSMSLFLHVITTVPHTVKENKLQNIISEDPIVHNLFIICHFFGSVLALICAKFALAQLQHPGICSALAGKTHPRDFGPLWEGIPRAQGWKFGDPPSPVASWPVWDIPENNPEKT